MEQFNKNHAGIEPSIDMDNLVYPISTNKSLEFLYTKRFAKVAKDINSNGGRGGHRYEFKIQLSTLKISNKFYPLLLTVPADAIIVPDTTDMEPIFRMELEYNERPRLVKEFYDTLKGYMYTGDQRNGFKTEIWRDENNFSKNAQKLFLNYTRPTYIDTEDVHSNEVRACIVLLNPVNVFHDMLDKTKVDENGKVVEPGDIFEVSIEGVRPSNDGQYVYTVRRKVKGRAVGNDRKVNSKQVTKNIQKQLLRQLHYPNFKRYRK